MTKSISLLAGLLFCLTYSFGQSVPNTLPFLIKDDFNDNSSLWANGSSIKIENGKLVISNGTVYKDVSTLSLGPHMVNPKENYSIEIAYEVADQTPGFQYGIGWGIRYATNSSDGCYFWVNTDKSFSISKTYMSKTTTHKDWTKHDKIRTQVGEVNVLKIEGKNGMTNFYINATLVHQSTLYHNYLRHGLCYKGAGTVKADYLYLNYKTPPINLANNLPPDIRREKLGEAINSSYSEMNPIISPDGKQLYVVRENHPDNLGQNKYPQDAWVSTKRSDGSWEVLKNMGEPINNADNNSVLAVTSDNNTLLLSNWYYKDKPMQKGFSMSSRTAQGWSYPINLNIKNYYNNDLYSEACLSANSKVLLMSLNREDALGGRDIYVSFRQNDTAWSEPLNLGASLNGYMDESSPFLASDGVTLYFSSRSYPGYGNADIFVSKRLDDTWKKWSKPQNMGNIVNTPNFDSQFSIAASGDAAYLISRNELSLEDIYVIYFNKFTSPTPDKPITPDKPTIAPPTPPAPTFKPDPVSLIHGRVLNAHTKQPLSCKIVYELLPNGKEAGLAVSNPNDGEYKVVLPYGQMYGLHAKAEGYIAINENMDLTKVNQYQEVEYNLLMVPIEVGQSIQLKNVFFKQSLPEMLSSSYPELDRLAKILVENPNIEIDLAGHTDNQGDKGKNVILSEQRVQAVKKYLVSKGINEKRITGKGYGGSKPIASNDTEPTRKLNRRVEFTITKK